VSQVLVGQRYGNRDLPTSIPATDFTRIRTALASRRNRDLKHAVELLDACYELDENSVEPGGVYLATNRNSVSSLQSLTNVGWMPVCYLFRHCFIARLHAKISGARQQFRPSVRLSVCPPYSGFVLKRLNMPSKCHCLVAASFSKPNAVLKFQWPLMSALKLNTIGV